MVRETRVRQNLVFRRGLFHITLEAGAESDSSALVELAQAIDAKIIGRLLKKTRCPFPVGDDAGFMLEFWLLQPGKSPQLCTAGPR